MQKRLLQPLIIMIITLNVVSCCKKSFDDFYFRVNDIIAKNTYDFTDVGDGVTISQEGYRIKLKLNDAIKDAIEDINSVRKSLDYCEDNEVALKKDIASLRISCNTTIWNTPAGSALDLNNIRVFEHKAGIDSEPMYMTVNDWIQHINSKTQFVDFEWYLEFNEVITSTEYLKFQLQFELIDGSHYSTETGLVKLE